LAIQNVLKGKLYWHALRNAYTGSDDLFHYRVDVTNAFLSKEPERDFLMNKSERDYLTNLPEQITVYRAMTVNELEGGRFGCSWTLRREVAKFFAEKYQRNYSTKHLETSIHEMSMSKNEVIAFFNGRKEFEVIYIQGGIYLPFTRS
jgi:hypothetical protein